MTKKFSSPFIVLILAVLFSALPGCGNQSAEEDFMEAEVLVSKGEYRRALDAYTLITEKYPASPYTPRSILKTARLMDRYLDDETGAGHLYAELFYSYPDSEVLFEAATDLGAIHSRRGDHPKAIEQYQWIVDRIGRPERDSYKLLITGEYIEMNDFIQARIELADLMEERPETGLADKVLYRTALTYYLEGELDEAIDAFDRIIEEYPTESLAIEARLYKALALEESGSLAEARDQLKALKDDYPNPRAIEARVAAIEKRIKKKTTTKRRARKPRRKSAARKAKPKTKATPKAKPKAVAAPKPAPARVASPDASPEGATTLTGAKPASRPESPTRESAKSADKPKPASSVTNAEQPEEGRTPPAPLPMPVSSPDKGPSGTTTLGR